MADRPPAGALGQRHLQPGQQAHRRPRTPETGGKLLFVLLFWFGLATAVELWWLRTPPASLGTQGDILTAAGRVSGMAAGYTLLTQILLMSRVGWLERQIGAHTLVRWHRRLGAGLVFLVVTHLSFTVIGYAAVTNVPVLRQAWAMFADYQEVDDAFIAAAILITIALLAWRRIRQALPYEVWYWTHLSSYLVLLLGYAHQFTHGQELAVPGFGRWYWISLHLLVVAAVGWGRLIAPLALNLRHRLRVAEVVAESPQTVSIYITGRRLDRLAVQAGQHFRWRFLTRGCWWQTHPFSLSAAPNERWLRLTVKAVGGYTGSLRDLRPGVRVQVHGPAGMFTAQQRVRPAAVLIAAGSGIAPIRALLEDMPPGTVLIYRAGSEQELVLRDELDWFVAQRAMQVWYVTGSRHDPWPRHLLSGRGLRELVPDIAKRDVYVCGPPGLSETLRKLLSRLGVPSRQIHMDPFEF